MNNEFDQSDYVTVRERIEAFSSDCPRRAIRTEIVHNQGNTVVVRATVWPDVDRPDCCFVGHAEEDRNIGEVNAGGSALENCETSAVGRALAFMGYPVAHDDRGAQQGRISQPTLRQLRALYSGMTAHKPDLAARLRKYCGGRALADLTETEGRELIGKLKSFCVGGANDRPAAKVA